MIKIILLSTASDEDYLVLRRIKTLLLRQSSCLSWSDLERTTADRLSARFYRDGPSGVSLAVAVSQCQSGLVMVSDV